MDSPDPQYRNGIPGDQDGPQTARRPGELVFTLLLCLASLYLLWSAYGIAGFDALSSPGAVPMGTTAIMVIASVILLARTARLPRVLGEKLGDEVLPWVVLIFAGLLVVFSLLLQPLGFLPTAFLFLVAAIKILGRRSWGFTLTVSLASLVVIWVIFRVVFTVLMPSGIVPEAEFIQLMRNLFNGGGA
ncbi:tripartite tricarboxylate transporter TctB family protein [Oceanicola sp. 502str15]|uniref:tripartite tricarboxylate transporter TctB family protein n=1 Tax=Oceanicola sp. 502str15 TaxID=2696061 RepID=UPI002094B461|nr:tripartite tricarboxylate transporter TctB family protein [Oceanicola sp. 502str15]MCO6384665.1 tripartite tricarboxylate transporter TctB family protein [Oceanicola sp. 502str15]